MYTDFFGLTEQPFELHTDARFLYLSPAHARTQAFLLYALLKRDGIVTVTGDIGAGKSTMVDDLRQNLDPGYRLFVLHQTQLDDLELLKLFLLELGVRETTSGKAQTLGYIHRALIDGHDRGEKAVLIVDDAQNLSAAAIEELRMLADDECDGQRLLGLVLIGQPSLRDTLADERLEQVRQRIRLHYQLDPLAPDQVPAYIAHRLAVAGNTRDKVFDDDALDLIALYSRGVPRLINILCDMALTGSALRESHSVTIRCVSEAIEELGWEGPALAGGLRSGLGMRLIDGATAALGQFRSVAGRDANWADGQGHSPAAVARLGAHRQMQTWRGRAQTLWHALHTRTATARAAIRATLAAAQTAAERAAQTPAGGGLLSDLRWGIGGLYLARRSIVSTFAVMTLGVVFAVRFGASSDAAATTGENMLAAVSEVPPDRIIAATDQRAARSDDAVIAPPALHRMGEDVPAKTLPQTNLLIRDADWLMAQPPQAYSIQIIGAHNPKNVARFVRRNGVDDALAYYTMERKGQDFFLILHGVYDDAEAAAAARSAMSSDVQAGKPWIRQFADIQEAIRAARASRRVAVIDGSASSSTQ